MNLKTRYLLSIGLLLVLAAIPAAAQGYDVGMALARAIRRPRCGVGDWITSWRLCPTRAA